MWWGGKSAGEKDLFKMLFALLCIEWTAAARMEHGTTITMNECRARVVPYKLSVFTKNKETFKLSLNSISSYDYDPSALSTFIRNLNI